MPEFQLATLHTKVGFEAELIRSPVKVTRVLAKRSWHTKVLRIFIRYADADLEHFQQNCFL